MRAFASIMSFLAAIFLYLYAASFLLMVGQGKGSVFHEMGLLVSVGLGTLCLAAWAGLWGRPPWLKKMEK